MACVSRKGPQAPDPVLQLLDGISVLDEVGELDDLRLKFVRYTPPPVVVGSDVDVDLEVDVDLYATFEINVGVGVSG